MSPETLLFFRCSAASDQRKTSHVVQKTGQSGVSIHALSFCAYFWWTSSMFSLFSRVMVEPPPLSNQMLSLVRYGVGGQSSWTLWPSARASLRVPPRRRGKRDRGRRKRRRKKTSTPRVWRVYWERRRGKRRRKMEMGRRRRRWAHLYWDSGAELVDGWFSAPRLISLFHVLQFCPITLGILLFLLSLDTVFKSTTHILYILM